MPRSPGDRLGPYVIVAPLGAGGMGEVYKVRDTRLERTVAIKVAKDAFTERFRNEALAIAALNHPHIATLFDVGPDYLVMEQVEGQPLRGPLPVEKALRLAGQIADALEHAHRHGIIHRDLKPSNVLVTKSGVKVLDFGLAQRSAPPSDSAQGVAANDVDGAFVGTPRYMAPEQIDGKAADERTDIFAFGLVLYEMLTGQRPFEGRSAAGVMASILEKEPTPIATLLPGIPPAVEDVVRTCLAKDAAERWQSVRELRHALAWAASPERVSRTRGRRGWTAAVMAAAVLLGMTAVWFVRRGTGAARPLPVSLEIALPEKALLRWTEPVAVSPDGRQIALSLLFPGKLPQLYLRPLDSLALTPVPDGERGARPFWSPDGRRIGFTAVPGVLKTVDLSAGSAQTLCRLVNTIGATWSREDVIVFSDGGRLFRVPAGGGEPQALGRPNEGELRIWPQFLPDGRHYLYLSYAARREDRGIYVGALDSDLRKRLVATDHKAVYSAPGLLLFIREGALLSQPFDAQRLELTGEPVPVLERVALGGEAGLAHFSVTQGALVWRTGPASDLKQPTWFDRSGRRLGTLGDPAVYYRPVLSPDEKSAAICREESESSDIWIIDVRGGGQRRLTFEPRYDCGPTWSPDGRMIAFRSDRRGRAEIYQKRADGSGADELLLASEGAPLNVTDWSADGRFLAYNSPRPRYLADLFVLSLSAPGGPKPIPFLVTEALEDSGALSPNGRWMAYRSTEQGRFDVYVRGMSPGGEATPGKWQISSDGGWAPRWRRDGKELFYSTGTGIMALEVDTDASTFVAGPPRLLFDAGVIDEPGSAFDVSRNGQRFLVLVPVKPREPIRARVNWRPEGT